MEERKVSIEITPKNATALLKATESAISNGEAWVKFEGEEIPTPVAKAALVEVAKMLVMNVIMNEVIGEAMKNEPAPEGATVH